MKTSGLAVITTLTLAACGSGGALGTASGTGGGTGGATTTGGSGATGTTTSPRAVTFDTVDVHPAAKAALTNAGFPVPSITDGTYEIVMDGVKVVFVDGGAAIILTDAGIATITSTTGPYTFALTDEFLQQSAGLGVIGVVRPIAGGIGTGSLPQATCPQFAQLTGGVDALRDAGATGEIQGFLWDAGFIDYLMPTGLEVNGQAAPPTSSVTGAVAYGVPMSYAVMLNCAGQPAKTKFDTDTGVALVYITNGSAPGQGTPVAGAVSSLHNALGNPVPTYYSNDYTATDTTGTDATGVATYVGVSPQSTTPPTITIPVVNGLTFTQSYSISTQPNAFFSIVAYPH
jgi:hypothetical protein